MKLLTFILILKVILLLFVSTYYFYNNFKFLSLLFINSSQLIIYFYIFKDLIFDCWKNSKLSTVINDFLRKLYFLNILFISFNYTLIIFMIKSQNGINKIMYLIKKPRSKGKIIKLNIKPSLMMRIRKKEIINL